MLDEVTPSYRVEMKPCGWYSGVCATTARTPKAHQKRRASERRIRTSRGWARTQDAPTLRDCTDSVDPEVAVGKCAGTAKNGWGRYRLRGRKWRVSAA